MTYDSLLPYEELLRRNYRYEEESERFYFLSEDSEGNEIELSTEVKLLWSIRPGSYSSTEDDPEAYYDLYTLITSEIGSTTLYNTGEKVKPEKVLDKEEYKRYSQGLDEFISKYE